MFAFQPRGSGFEPLRMRYFFQPRASVFEPLRMRYFFTSNPKQKLTLPALRPAYPFRLCETFLEIFHVPKVSSLQFFLIFCNRTKVEKSQRVSFRFFGNMRLLEIRIFFRKFFKVSKGSLQFFDIFKNEWLLTNLEEPPFTVFGIARFFKISRFCFKIRFSQAQHSISDLFSKTGVFLCNFFSNLFSLFFIFEKFSQVFAKHGFAFV